MGICQEDYLDWFNYDKEGLDTDMINALILERLDAKKNKNFETADLIREELDKLGVQIKDGREGSSWEVKK
mgnify:CR=1 FL=1